MPGLRFGGVGEATERFRAHVGGAGHAGAGVRCVELLHGAGRLWAFLGPDVSDESPEPTESAARPMSYWLSRASRNVSGWRPASFWLLLAILVVMVLGLRMVGVRDDPKQFALYLTLMLVFFFVVIARAIVDCIDIWRRGFSERERLFKDTLGDDEFVAKLSKRVEQGRDSR